MLRFLAPYLAVATIIAVIDGVALGADAISAVAVYGLILLALLPIALGAVRWEQRQPWH